MIKYCLFSVYIFPRNFDIYRTVIVVRDKDGHTGFVWQQLNRRFFLYNVFLVHQNVISHSESGQFGFRIGKEESDVVFQITGFARTDQFVTGDSPAGSRFGFHFVVHKVFGAESLVRFHSDRIFRISLQSGEYSRTGSQFKGLFVIFVLAFQNHFQSPGNNCIFLIGDIDMVDNFVSIWFDGRKRRHSAFRNDRCGNHYCRHGNGK